jgi:hypothetical protein
LQIPNLARVIGQTKHLNPALFWVKGAISGHAAQGKFAFTEKLDLRYLGKNTGYLRFKPSSIVSSTGTLVTDQTATFTQGPHQLGVSGTTGDFYVDSSTGQFWTFDAMLLVTRLLISSILLHLLRRYTSRHSRS